MTDNIAEARSLAETPTWLVASVTTVMVVACLLLERSIYRFGKWLKKTRRKALLASLEKIKEELMLLGLISLMLGQCARWISGICVDSKLFNSRFFFCSEEDYLNIDVISAYSSSKSSPSKTLLTPLQPRYSSLSLARTINSSLRKSSPPLLTSLPSVPKSWVSHILHGLAALALTQSWVGVG